MSDARAVPFYCPFCAEQDLFPTEAAPRGPGGAADASLGGRPGGSSAQETTHGAWHCRSCTRVFTVRLVGLVTT